MNRIKTLDYLKTIAIIGVVLFHIGISTDGYLGVEIFFVISGYLFVKTYRSNLEKDTFNPIKFIIKKLSAFWPLVVIAGAISLIIGYIGMLPDDYENLAESVVASNVFVNNILQAITTKNYWDVGNIYKPLMHMWYISVLLQNFVFLAIILWLSRKVTKKDYTRNILIGISSVSLLLFILPIFTTSDKFYYFQFRLFEMGAGGMIVFLPKPKIKEKVLRLIGDLGIVVLLLLLFANIKGANTLLLLLVVIVTCIVIYLHSSIKMDYGICDKAYNIISLPGKYSYDIYIWHQLSIAFLYYFVFQELNVWLVFFVLLSTIAMTFISVWFRRKCVVLKMIKKRVLLSIVLLVVTSAASLLIYIHAGVVRNVPELGIDVNNVHRNMHAEYVDVPYSWDKDFEDDSKIHVLVIGNSFGRDFANILNESTISNKLEISYIYEDEASGKMERISEADFVFYGINRWDVSDWVSKNVDSEKLYIVGNKEFGNSNGIFYANRNKEWYFNQIAELPEEFIINNNAFRLTYGDHYIDMITPILDGNKISVFSDDHFFISQDCRHLTKHGAQFYSRILDLSFILEKM